jgi:CubicO group peptidase (beta-lactamase class C family)
MRKIILVGFGILCASITLAQSSQAVVLDSLFTSLHQKKSFNGTVLIAEKGKVIFEKSYGLANEEKKLPINKETIFELASVSKQFTAMGIVLLVKQGKLKYEDPIAKYIPELAFYGNITVSNLLHHTGGLPDYMELFEENWDKSKFAVNQDIVDLFATYKPKAVFPPNEKFEYSNTGYALLGLLIEKVSHTSFEAFLKENIFQPLQMKKTFVYRSRFKPQKVENYAYGYVLDSLGNKVLTDSFGKSFYTYYLDGIVGDGMVNSNAGDLLKWDRALCTDKLVNEADKAAIFKSVTTSDGKETNYGFGWFLATNEKYGTMVNHSGGWAGYITFIERHLTNDKTIILLQNNSLPTTKIPQTELRKILYNEPLIAAKVIEVNTADLDQYLGVYANENFPLKITITKKENILYTHATGQNEIAMVSYENHTFKFDPADITLVFNVDEKTFELTQGGMKLVFTRE